MRNAVSESLRRGLTDAEKRYVKEALRAHFEQPDRGLRHNQADANPNAVSHVSASEWSPDPKSRSGGSQRSDASPPKKVTLQMVADSSPGTSATDFASNNRSRSSSAAAAAASPSPSVVLASPTPGGEESPAVPPRASRNKKQHVQEF